MRARLRSAAHALRSFLRGFVGLPPRGGPPGSHVHGDGAKRPFCC